MDYKISVSKGALMTVGILGSTFVVKKVKRDMAPPLSVGSAPSLGVVTILSKIAIDYGKMKQWIPENIK